MIFVEYYWVDETGMSFKVFDELNQGKYFFPKFDMSVDWWGDD